MFRQIYPDAKRGYQSRGGTAAAPDVDFTPFYIECKAGAPAKKWREAWEQAAKGGDFRFPLAVVKEDRKEPQVVIRVDHLALLCNMQDMGSGPMATELVRMPLDRFIAALAAQEGKVL